MICRNCQATVDNDLVFCTNCGARLYETMSDASTVAMNDSIVTQTSTLPVKKTSPFKWIALIVALVALPVSLGIAYLLMKNQPAKPTANGNQTVPVNRKPANKTASKNINTAVPNVTADASPNASWENSNEDNSETNTNADATAEPIIIFNEQIEIASGEHTAYPFKLENDAKIFGKLQTLRGESLQGYVFTQTSYDENFPDANYKMFSFEGKNPAIEQFLIKGDYVLIFLNETESPIVIKGKVETKPNE